MKKQLQISFEGIHPKLLAEAHKIVQGKLFELGFSWSGTKELRYPTSTHLQIGSNWPNEITYSHCFYRPLYGEDCYTSHTYKALDQMEKWVEILTPEFSRNDIVIGQRYTNEKYPNYVFLGCWYRTTKEMMIINDSKDGLAGFIFGDGEWELFKKIELTQPV